MNDIQGKVLIVRPSISMPGNSRTDESLTTEVQDNHGTTNDSGRYVKQLFPKSSLAKLQKVASRARKWHKENTLYTRFGDIVPTALYDAWDTYMKTFVDSFEQAVDEFVGNYDTILEEARHMHKGTFDISDYPPAYKVRDEFSFTLFTSPMPRGDNVVVSHLTKHHIDTVRAQIETEAARATWDATREMTRRILEKVGAITDRLGASDTIFRDTLITNLKDLLQIAPAMNIAEDPTLTALINDCKNKLLVAPDILRDNKGQRQSVFVHSKTITSRYGLGGRMINRPGESSEKKAA